MGRFSVVVVATALLAGCSGGGGGDAAPSSTTTSEAPSSTIVSDDETTTTTAEPAPLAESPASSAVTTIPVERPTESTTTTTVALTPEQQHRLDVGAGLDRFAEAVTTSAVPTPDPDSPALTAALADPILTHTRDTLRESLEFGEEWFGTYEVFDFRVLTASDTDSLVEVCSRDGLGARDADGEVVVEPDTFFETRQISLVKRDDRWLVSDVGPGDDVRCDS